MSNPPRLRTLANYPGPQVEVNGVLLPAEQWSFSQRSHSAAPIEVDVRFLAELVPDDPEPTVSDCRPDPTDACSDCPPEAPPVPRVGETVHYVDYTLPLPGQRNDLVCLPALVVRAPTWVTFENCDAYNGGRTMLVVFNPLAGDAPQYRDARHESHPDNAGRFLTWHYADSCPAVADAPDVDCCAVAPEANARTTEPAPSIHLVLSTPRDALVHDVDALIRKLAKKAESAGLSLSLG